MLFGYRNALVTLTEIRENHKQRVTAAWNNEAIESRLKIDGLHFGNTLLMRSDGIYRQLLTINDNTGQHVW